MIYSLSGRLVQRRARSMACKSVRFFKKNTIRVLVMNRNKNRGGGLRTVQLVGQVGPSRVLAALTLGYMSLGCVLALTAPLKSASAQTPAPPVFVSAAATAREWRTPPAGDVQRGSALYQQRCTACHAVDSNKIGPAHRGVVGRRIGSLPGYKYSDELARSRLRWTPQTLNAWLEDPEELIAGQRMGFQVENSQERADLIAYLLTLK